MKAQEVERRVCQEGVRKSFEKDRVKVCTKGQDLNFICQKFRRSSGFKSREETLRKFSKFLRIEVFKGEAQKLKFEKGTSTED